MSHLARMIGMGTCLFVAGMLAWADAPTEIWVGPHDGAGAVTTIQAAIDAVAAGGTVYVAAGSYAERLTITKPLTLLGAKAGVIPAERDTPSEESILVPPTHDLSLPRGTLITIAADNVTVDGFTLDGDNPLISSGEPINGYDMNAALAVGQLNGDLAGVLVGHNIIRNFSVGGVRFDCPSLPHQPKGINAVVYNHISNLAPEALGVRANGQHLRVAYNTVLDATYGIQMHFISSLDGTSIPQVTGNTVRATTAGIMMVLLNSQTRVGGPSALVNHNTVQMTTTDREDFPATSLVIHYIEHQTQLLVSDNTFSGGDVGISLWEIHTANLNNVTIANTTIIGARYGIWFRNWLPMPETGAARPSGALFSNVTVRNATEAGICLDGGTRGDTITTTLRDVTVDGGPVGLLLRGAKITLDGVPTLRNQTRTAMVAEDGAILPNTN